MIPFLKLVYDYYKVRKSMNKPCSILKAYQACSLMLKSISLSPEPSEFNVAKIIENSKELSITPVNDCSLLAELREFLEDILKEKEKEIEKEKENKTK